MKGNVMTHFIVYLKVNNRWMPVISMHISTLDKFYANEIEASPVHQIRYI